MSNRTIRGILTSLLVALVVGGGVGPQRPAVASDHDEAPLITNDISLNTTDFYAFLGGGLVVTTVSNPGMIGVPHDPNTFNDADTVLHFDQFIEAGMGSGTVGFEFSGFRFRSTQPLVLAFSNGSTAQYDVEVTNSPTTPSTGSVQLFENTAGTGGNVIVDITLYMLMTFTNRATGEVTVVDGGVENLPTRLEGSTSYSYSCPPGFLSIPDVTADFCLGHFPGASSISPTTLIDINDLNDPALVWRVRPATAPVNPNRTPILEPIGPLMGIEGQTNTFNFSATDPDGDELIFVVGGDIPQTGCRLTTTGPQQVTYDCDPRTVAGVYDIIVTVFAPAGATDVESVTLTIKPFLEAGPNQTVNQGDQITLAPNASTGATIEFDLDGDGVYETLGPTAIFDFSGLGLGDYTIGVRATKNGAATTDTVIVTVVAPNLPPTFEYTGPSTVVEGGTIIGVLTITDPEAVDITSLTVSPSSEDYPCLIALDSEAGPGLATIEFLCETRAGDEGEYEFVITAGDGANTATTTVVITVLHANAAPVLTPIDDVTVDEGGAVTVPVAASDADGHSLTITASGTPSYGAFVDNEDGTGSFTFTPTFDDAGTTTITVRATDDGDPNLFDEDTFTIIVTNVNLPPVLGSIDDLTVDVGATGMLTITATDPDGNGLSFDADVPPFCLLNDNGDGSADIQCNPDEGDAGDHPGFATVTDDGDPALIDSSTFTILVLDQNRSPSIDSISGQTTINEGQTTTIQVAASDPDGDNLTMTLEGNPAFCTIVDNGGGSATITCGPGFSDSGSHTFRVFATDDGTPVRAAGAPITIVVNNVNRPPVLDAIDDQTVIEDGELFGTFTATDPDGDAVTISASGLPGFCTLTDNGDGTAFFECNPEVGDAGESTITVTASAGTQQATQTFKVIVQPKISLNVPGTAKDGELVQLEADSQSCGNEVCEYDWDFNGDNVFSDAVGPNPPVDTATLDLGENALAVQGCLPGTTICNIATATVTVEPTILIDGLRLIYTGRTTTFNATLSRPNVLFNYEWDLDGDGNFDDATGQTLPVNTFDLGAGTYNVLVRGFQPNTTFNVTSNFSFEVVDADGVSAGGPYATGVNVPIDLSADCTTCDDNLVTWEWDLDNDGEGDASGQTTSFIASTPGTYAVTVTACLDGVDDPASCAEDQTEVIVEGPGIETYDELESLVRAHVDSPLVERLLTTPLALAQYFDEVLGLDAAARPLLRIFIRLVERFTPGFISPDEAEQLIDFAESLLNSLD